MNARSHTTIRGLVVGTVVRNLAWAVAILASWSVATGLAGGAQLGQLAPASEPPVDRVGVLVARHGCWTGTAPDPTAEPRRAVVTPREGRPKVVRAAAGYRIWLEGQPGTVHAFCP